MKIVALIPARSGSKRIKNKNIKLYAGRPLVFWSIDIALKSNYISDIFITTDSNEIINLINSHYNNPKIICILRPDSISGDLSTDYEFIEHFLKDHSPELIIQLRPTYPNRKLEDLNNTIRIMLVNYDSYDSLRTVCPSKYTPYKMYEIKDNHLTPLFTKISDINEPYNMPAQILPKSYVTIWIFSRTERCASTWGLTT